MSSPFAVSTIERWKFTYLLADRTTRSEIYCSIQKDYIVFFFF